jgi:hypothetical protein
MESWVSFRGDRGLYVPVHPGDRNRHEWLEPQQMRLVQVVPH